MAGQRTPDDEPGAVPSSDGEPGPATAADDQWPAPPPPPAAWGPDPGHPPVPPWAAPPLPPYGPASPGFTEPEQATPPEPPETEEWAAEAADPWRIPPQAPWDPTAEPAPPPMYDPAGGTTPGDPAPRFPAHDDGGGNQPTAIDLPPSATGPRSSPRPPAAPGHEPRGRQEGRPVRFDEPWRMETPGRADRKMRLRPILITVAGVVAAAVVAAGVYVLADRGKGTPQVPAAELAGRIFTADPAARTDGRDQELLGVASSGPTVVAIGGEADTADYRAEFLVSTDGGRSFRLAGLHTSDGAEPAYGDVPQVIAGSDGAWVALGSSHAGTAVWTSHDGRAWVRQPDTAGAAFGHDRITRVARTASGFVAVGDTSPKGDYSDAVPVVWLSPDGRNWQRLGNDQLGMSLSGGPLSLVDVAAVGNTVLVYGWTTDHKGRVVRDAVWRSGDGGRSWATAGIPHPKGTAGPGVAITATPNGFVAGRNASDKSEHYGVIMTSADGRQWRTAGEIHLPGYGGLQRLAGSDRGLAALIGGGDKVLLARSADGRSWQNAGEVPAPAGVAVQGVAVTPSATIVAARQAGADDTDAVLAVRDSLGQDLGVDPARVAGAVQPDQALTSIATGSRLSVAVGSTNGDAAAWTSADGKHWSRAQAGGQAFAQPGKQRLISVVSGNAGWLAVGFDATHPLVVASDDGRTWRSADGGGAFAQGKADHVATYAATAGPAGYVVVGESGSSAATWHSTDLKSWDRGTGADLAGDPAANRWMRGVVGGSFGYVAVGGLNDPAVKNAPPGRPAAWTSTDGRTWTLHRIPLPSRTVDGWFDKVAAVGNVIVAAGSAATTSGRVAFAFVSGDGGTSWQEVRLPDAGPDGPDSSDRNSLVTSVTATPHGFVVAGAVGRLGRSDVVLWTSRDGHAWTAQTPRGTGLSGRGDQWLTGMTPLGADLLAVGVSADHRGEQPTLWRRPLP